MAIEIKNYVSPLGLVVKDAYLTITELYCLPKSHTLNFSADIFSGPTAQLPIERNAATGNLVVDDTLNLEQVAEDAIQFKIDSVVGKTQQECDEHNKSVTDWINVWDLAYLRFISDDTPTEDENYIQAAKIMLEGE